MNKTADDRRREKELEEARKAGTVPAERDAEGNEINPHIPQFMSQAPWYLNAEGPGLQHQRNLKEKQKVAGVSDFIPRGQTAGPAATKFRKGACTNCGAMTHQAKDCLDRPRKKGARFSGKDFKPDEVVVEMGFDYAGKRDHWAQYDPSDHTHAIEAHQKEMEILIKQHKQEQMAKLALKEKDREQRAKDDAAEGVDTDGDTDDEGGDDAGPDGKLDESEQLNVGTKMNANRNGGAKMSVRNLRIREDTAKYLLNLDVNSAYYDPKTHSMRENPLPDVDHGFVPYNEERRSGDARELARLQMYEIEATGRGQNIHMNADPTTTELMNKIYREKKDKLVSSKVNKVVEKYGGAEHLQKPPEELVFAQTEEYVEYTPTGALRDGREKAVVRSKYEEDVHAHNHSCTWGSYFDRRTFRWGYADDHATTRNAYGMGAAASRTQQLEAAHSSSAAHGDVAASGDVATKALSASAIRESTGGVAMAPPMNTLFGTGESLPDKLDDARVRAAVALERERQRASVADERKRKYNSMTSESTTAEDIEAYHRAKSHGDDPMANLIGQEDV
mmetsp:Transcript_1782/g.5053  ORF Transcript_1782/g.5053 Transcript_1782/m.5053 type:complete len:561 (-) Transcript_1782:668-2350(-)